MNSSLALTTAKYYTPDNKCIQRDFEERDDYFFFLNNKDYDTDPATEGGVIPDILVKSDLYPEPIVNFISRGVFFEFARFLAENETGITTEFSADQRILKKFREFLDNNKVSYDAGTFKTYADDIRREIEREVLSHKFSPAEGVKAFLKSDPVTQKAIDVLKNY